jgi:hypothetical protein
MPAYQYPDPTLFRRPISGMIQAIRLPVRRMLLRMIRFPTEDFPEILDRSVGPVRGTTSTGITTPKTAGWPIMSRARGWS